MSVEFDYFIASNKKWFCHFDDDNYVNIPRLVGLLRQYHPLEDWYLGKPSIKQPLEIQDRDSKVSAMCPLVRFTLYSFHLCLEQSELLVCHGRRWILYQQGIGPQDDSHCEVGWQRDVRFDLRPIIHFLVKVRLACFAFSLEQNYNSLIAII